MKLKLLGLMTAVLFCAGCIETTQHFIVNPDLTGKVEHEMTLPSPEINVSNTAKSQDPSKKMKTLVKDVLTKSVGVSAWKNVEFKLLDDDRIWFKGTAYFDNINDLDIYKGGVSLSLMQINMEKRPDGDIVLLLSNEKEKDVNKSTKVIPNLSEEEIIQEIKKAKVGFEQMQPMLAGIFGTLKMNMTFSLPGRLAKASNFEKEENGDLSVNFYGKKFMDELMAMTTDENWWKEQVLAGRNFQADGPKFDMEMNEKMFGEKEPIEAIVWDIEQPLFDYESEVSAANENFDQEMEQLELQATVPAQASGGELQNVRIGGSRFIWDSSDDFSGLRPFNFPNGLTYSILADLPGAVLSVEGGIITKAIADTGEDLRPSKEWDRKINFPNLSEDKTSVMFEVNLKVPSQDVAMIEILSGELEYSVASETKMVDLGITDFKNESVGVEYDATIVVIKSSDWDKELIDLELRLDLPRDAVKEIFIYDENGQKINAKINGTMSMNDVTTFTLQNKDPYPLTGRIEIEVYEGLKKFIAPFELKNISVIGR